MKGLTARRAEYVERLEAGLARVVAALKQLPEVRRISVFGSYARGRRDLSTDLDLLVVMETNESIPERLSRLYSVLDAGVDMDLIVWTPAEYERMRSRPFGRSIAASEKILHEA